MGQPTRGKVDVTGRGREGERRKGGTRMDRNEQVRKRRAESFKKGGVRL